MDTLTLVILLAALGLAVLVGGGLTLLRGRRSRPRPGKAALPPLTDLEERPGERPPERTGDVKVVAPPGDPTAPAARTETPEPVAGRMARLRARFGSSQSTLGRGLLGLLSKERLDDAAWEEVEEVLLTADVGVGPTQELVERLRTRVKELGSRDAESVRTLLREELLTLVGPDADRSLRTTGADGRPAVVLVVGVNGTGKTTTVGKLARVLVAEHRTVLLGAADTFRAAAADQLTTWGERVGAPVVRGPEGGDPASVAFDAVKQGDAGGYDVVLVDTAGRLQNKVGLMDELGKVKRVIEKQGPVDEVLLVLDATTGQNGLVQARVFAEVVDITGIVLTKLDGTAKGGIVVAVQRELGVPVKLVGLGEGADDLAPFDPEVFVDALLGDPAE
jgi:fused signal recognition particle receptor